MEYTMGITVGILLAVLTMAVLAKIYLWVYNMIVEKKETAAASKKSTSKKKEKASNEE